MRPKSPLRDAASHASYVEKSKAAAWAWYERSAVGNCSASAGQKSLAYAHKHEHHSSVMVGGKYMKRKPWASRQGEGGDKEQVLSSRRKDPRPSRFKREAEARARVWQQHIQQQKENSSSPRKPLTMRSELRDLQVSIDCGCSQLDGVHDHRPSKYCSRSSCAISSSPSSTSPTSSSGDSFPSSPPPPPPSPRSSLSPLLPTAPIAVNAHPAMKPDFTHPCTGPSDLDMACNLSLLADHVCSSDLSSPSISGSVSLTHRDSEFGSFTSSYSNGSGGNQETIAAQNSSLLDSFEVQDLIKALDAPYHAYSHELRKSSLYYGRNGTHSNRISPIDLKDLHYNLTNYHLTARAIGSVDVPTCSSDSVTRLESPPECSPIVDNILEYPRSPVRAENHNPAFGLSTEMAINRCSDAELPVHSRHTLHELLQWSPRGTKSLDCHCPSDDVSHHDFCYHEADPDVHLRSCNSDACTAKATRHRRRRTSLLVPHLPHSFRHALHHLPHSLSNALHHIPHLPHSISSALGQITHLTHSLSSAYKHHFASHRHGADVHHAHDPKHHVAFHLRHLFSFKVHNHSAAHVGDPVASSSNGAHPNSSAIPAPAAYSNSSKSSPSKERRLSASDYYMPIYTSKKHLKDGTVYHHHHHHHYHHHHYIL